MGRVPKSSTSAFVVVSLATVLFAPLSVQGFSVSRSSVTSGRSSFALSSSSTSAEEKTEVAPSAVAATDPSVDLTQQSISNLRFRELHYELSTRNLSTEGTTGQLRERLRLAALPGAKVEECIVNEDGIPDDCTEAPPAFEGLVDFVDESDPNHEFNDLVSQIHEKSDLGHWKGATRKLKRLTRYFQNNQSSSNFVIEPAVYLAALDACMDNRLQGARASEPARKILEQLVEQGYDIPESSGNYCIQNCLGNDADGLETTHQGFGGLDTALAMEAALRQAGTPLTLETEQKLMNALAKEDGSMTQALEMLKNLIQNSSHHLELEAFADLAKIVVQRPIMKATDNDVNQQVIQILTLTKAAGYELDKIASFPAGRSLLASGIVAAERMGNDALAFRLLTAASKVTVTKMDDEDDTEGTPTRADALVAHESSPTERACTLIHKRAILNAVEDKGKKEDKPGEKNGPGQWQLAVKVLELMLERRLRPSKWLWRNVVACCARAEKSRKATAVLFDWVRLYEEGKMNTEKPPLSVFNTVVNVCEICKEEDLTLMVLDQMKKSHNTDGNIITFNIALKRLAKQGNYRACEGIVIGMLQAGVEPTVVSYTTAIAACAALPEDRHPATAYEWLKRMRSRRVVPNVRTYNTALASCVDGTAESLVLAGQMAKEMIEDVEKQLVQGEAFALNGAAVVDAAFDVNHNVFPDVSTRETARQLLAEQESLDAVTSDELETALGFIQQLVDFESSEAASRAQSLQKRQSERSFESVDQAASTTETELELEYSAAHRTAEV